MRWRRLCRLRVLSAQPTQFGAGSARALAAKARGRAKVVALLVDPDDALIEAVIATVAPDLIQLHGEETPTRVADILARWGIPVMKAIKVRDSA